MLNAQGAMDMTPDEIAHAVQTSAATWSANANPCSFLQINADAPGVDGGSSPPPPESAIYDKRNSLIFQTVPWCGPKNSMGDCSFDSTALAITSVFVVPSDGTIKDADIEVNSVNFIWADLDITKDLNRQDLQ